MKKFVKVFSIIMMVVNLMILAVSILALSQPEAIGEWIVSFYEELTNDLGHTVQGMYAKLSLIASISGCLALIASTVLCESCYVYICKCDHKCKCQSVESEGTDVKSEEENSEETMARLSREEKALLKAEKKAAKEAKKALKKQAAPVEEVKEVEQPKSSAAEKTKRADDFLASLKRK